MKILRICVKKFCEYSPQAFNWEMILRRDGIKQPQFSNIFLTQFKNRKKSRDTLAVTPSPSPPPLSITYYLNEPLEQGSQTSGTRHRGRMLPTRCIKLCRPRSTKITEKTVSFVQTKPFYEHLFAKLWSAEVFFIKLRPAEHFPLECGPSNMFSLRPVPLEHSFDV